MQTLKRLELIQKEQQTKQHNKINLTQHRAATLVQKPQVALINEVFDIMQYYQNPENHKEGYQEEINKNCLEILHNAPAGALSHNQIDMLLTKFIVNPQENQDIKLQVSEILINQTLDNSQYLQLQDFLEKQIAKYEDVVTQNANSYLADYYKTEFLDKYKTMLKALQGKQP